MFNLNLAGMILHGHIAPQFGAAVFEPEDARRCIGRDVFGVGHLNHRAFVLHDLKSLERIAVRLVEKAPFNTVVSRGLANL